MNFFISKMVRNRVMAFIEKHPKAVLAGLALYIISPIDLLPEAFFGPLGTFDDILAAIAGVAILKMILKKRAAARATAPVPSPAQPPAPRAVEMSRRDEAPRRPDSPRRDDGPRRDNRPRRDRDDRHRRNDRRPRRDDR